MLTHKFYAMLASISSSCKWVSGAMLMLRPTNCCAAMLLQQISHHAAQPLPQAEPSPQLRSPLPSKHHTKRHIPSPSPHFHAAKLGFQKNASPAMDAWAFPALGSGEVQDATDDECVPGPPAPKGAPATGKRSTSQVLAALLSSVTWACSQLFNGLLDAMTS